MVVKFYKLEDLIRELREIACRPVRVQGIQFKMPITYGNAKEQFQVMHIVFSVRVTAKFNEEIHEYSEQIGMIPENEDKRRIKTLQNKSIEREHEIVKELKSNGFETGRGIYESG